MRESEQIFCGAFENTGVGILTMSADRKMRRVNQAFCDLIGYSQEAFSGMSLRSVSHPEDTVEATSLHHQDFTINDRATVFRRFIHKDGDVIHTLGHGLINLGIPFPMSVNWSQPAYKGGA